MQRLFTRMLSVLSLALLITFNVNAAGETIVSLAGGSEKVEFKGMMELSDGTFLIAGGASSMTWLSGVTPTVLDTVGAEINAGDPNKVGFLLHVTADLKTVVAAFQLPDATVSDISEIKTNTAPGVKTGMLYISGRRDFSVSGGSGYFIGQLDNNFVDGNPTKLNWSVNPNSSIGGENTKIDLSSAVSWQRIYQPWDVLSDGSVLFASGSGGDGRAEYAFPWNQILYVDKDGNSSFRKGFTVNNIQVSYLGDTNQILGDSGFSVRGDKEVGDEINRDAPINGTYFGIYNRVVNVGDSVWVRVREFDFTADTVTAIRTVKCRVEKFRTEGSSYLMAKHKGTGLPSFRSNAQADFDFVGVDENGNYREGKGPNDFFWDGPCALDTLDRNKSRCDGGLFGYTGHSGDELHTSRTGDIVVDKNTDMIYLTQTMPLAYTKTLKSYLGKAADFESNVIAIHPDSGVMWYARMHQDDTLPFDFNSTGSNAPQFADHLAIDYTNNELVVIGRQYDTCQFNLWYGDKISASPSASGVQNKPTGTRQPNSFGANGVEMSWIGRYGLSDGKIYAATYVANEYQENGKAVPFNRENIKGFANPNVKDMDLAHTFITGVTVGPKGEVVILGTSSDVQLTSRTDNARTLTTEDAFQKMPINGDVPSNAFIRVYDKSLSNILYSSLMTGRFDSDGKGGNNTKLMGVHVIDSSVIVTGYQTSGMKSIPTVNVPAWGSGQADTSAENGILAKLHYKATQTVNPNIALGIMEHYICGDSSTLMACMNAEGVTFSGNTFTVEASTSSDFSTDLKTVGTATVDSLVDITLDISAFNPIGAENLYFRMTSSSPSYTSNTFELPVKPVPNIPVITGTSDLAPGDSNIAYAATSFDGYSLDWTVSSDITALREKDDTLFIKVANEGTYEIAVTQSGICGTSDTGKFEVKVLGFETLAELGVSVYPNPTSSFVTVDLGTSFGSASYSLVNNLGQAVKAGSLSNVTSIDMATLPAGVYSLIIEGSSFNESVLIIKQ